MQRSLRARAEPAAGRPAEQTSVDLWAELLARRRPALPVHELLASGGPDARPAALPDLLADLLADPAWRSPEVATALTDVERGRLVALPQPLRAAASRLADGLPSALQHDDLHSDNVFVRDATVRVIDWGNACVARPFGTLLVTLRSLAAEWRLPSRAPELRRVQEAYLEPRRVAGESRSELACQVDPALRTAGLARAGQLAACSEQSGGGCGRRLRGRRRTMAGADRRCPGPTGGSPEPTLTP